jgi:hypothetical protein
LVVRDKLLSFTGLDTQRLRVLKVTAPVHHFDATLLRQAGNPSAKLLQNRVLPCTKFIEVNLRWLKTDTPVF